ncbi:sucrase ferredoxin [Aeromicrobium sp. CF4.19]|uniref:sucrase ferredoxin n=1 Tax=Aeromicrobium sp. CF4.19 TaxID=3373082 RepID=UPI003EE4C6C8
MADPPVLCADTARDRGDPIVGTALHVRRFLLVEHPGPWPFHALEAEGLQDVVPELVAATRAASGRTFLIRRHGRQDADGPRAWAVADVAAGRIIWGTWQDPSDLRAAVAALAADSTSWSEEPVLLVCAHGRHDTCCAVRGRPVAAALAARWPQATWECSHVGGDRFAANVVVLPDGTYYGGLDDSTSPEVVQTHLEGAVATDFLRGSSTLPPVAQAVAAQALRRWGPAGPRAVTAGHVEQVADDAWRVRLDAVVPLPSLVTASVRAVPADPALLTCHAPRATSARRFEVEDLLGAWD